MVKTSQRLSQRVLVQSTHSTHDLVDVDDAWNLVGCLDTHLKRIVFTLYYFVFHVVVFCFKTL
ncbi:hypothetical protein Hanom_Chr03g00252281 [Helianthus anomalus]